MFRAMTAAMLTASVMLLATTPPAAAQAASSGRIAAVANNQAITIHDVRNRMALIFMTAGIPNNPSTRKKLLSQVLNQLIVESIQMQEAKRLQITVSDKEVATTLARIEKQNKMPPGRLFRILRARKVSPTTLVNQVKAGIAWSKVIRRSISARVRVSEAEVDEAINRLRNNKDKLIYRILEIYIPSGNDGGANALRTTRRLIQQIRRGANFSGLARQFSQASTATKGGDMGFVFEGQLAPQIEAAIKRVRPGQVIGPVRTTTGYYLLALVSKRTYGSGKPPTRKQISDSIFRQKVSIRARQYLRDLRRAAFVDIRI